MSTTKGPPSESQMPAAQVEGHLLGGEYGPDIRKLLIITRVFNLLDLGVMFGGAALIVYLGIALPISYSAGKSTTIDLLVRVITDLKLHVVIPYVLAAALACLWRRERHLRKTAVRREHERVELLEKQIDSSRTSSGLQE